ncbi:replication-relaxation family protein [Caldifermentibacillus hisashii]|uniref:replication-relaxation family protein n=1 Tax=Caldifermentibacillus hisashii TaxID=996558 RepID=UPI003368FCA3
MSMISEYRLTNCSMKLLELLFYYRGMTALQLTKMYYDSNNPLPTQKSNIHNYLNKLKRQSLVASKKLDDNTYLGSIYYLTSKGFEAAKEMLNIEVGATENGFILLNERSGIPTQSDLPYNLYQPPRQQVNHHLLLIDLFIQLRIHFSEEEVIDHRLSMYCSTPYTHEKMDRKIRPDAEILLPSKNSYWIEVDRATENHTQLLAKFNNYRDYLSYLKENNLDTPFKGIIFLTDAKQRIYGLKRRWTNILSAFLKAMYSYQSEIRLILTPLNLLEDTIRFEMKRSAFNQLAKHIVHDKLHKAGYKKVIPFIKTADKTLFYAIAIRKQSYKVFFLNVSNTFDSSMYTSFHHFLNILHKIHQKSEVKGLQSQGLEQIIFHPDKDPYILKTLQNHDSLKELEDELVMLNENIEVIQIDLPDDV